MGESIVIKRVIEEAARRHHLPEDAVSRLADFDRSGQRRLGVVLDRLAKGGRPLRAGDFAIGPHLFTPAARILRRRGAEIALTEKECDILLALYDAGGKAVSRQDLLDQVWGYASTVETHTLETHIYRLRQKLEEDAANPVLLVTREDGYALDPAAQ
jgi:DNA-binding response OmpR family regulator